MNECPKEYKIITCCFASLWDRARYCKNKFGFDLEGFILKNENGDRYEGIKFRMLKRRNLFNIKYEKSDEYMF